MIRKKSVIARGVIKDDVSQNNKKKLTRNLSQFGNTF